MRGGSQRYVSEIISWLHSLSLRVCSEISWVSWPSRGPHRGGRAKAQGAVARNGVFRAITRTTAVLVMKHAGAAVPLHFQ